MAGIDVKKLPGTGWEYSLDNVTWQPGNVFATQTDGTDFEDEVPYTVFCRNSKYGAFVTERIYFGRETSLPKDMIDLDQVLKNRPLTKRTPYFDGGVVATLPPEPKGSDFPTIVIGPDGLFYVRTKAPVYPSSYDQFQHFLFVPDSAAQVSDWRVRIDGNKCAVSGEPGYINGWAIDFNHPLLTPSVRITRNSVFEIDVVASEDRPDVLLSLKQQGLVPQEQTFCRYGYRWYKPDDTNNGQTLNWAVFGGTSTTRGISETGAPNATTCGTAPLTNNYRRSGSESTTEGQSSQLGLERQAGNGAWVAVLNSDITWSTVNAPSGVTLPGTGMFAVAANSISANASVEVHAAVTGQVIIFNQQIINTDCVRPGSLITYILAWNFTPQGGAAARAFVTMDDACNTVGAKLDNSAPGTLGTFYAQSLSLTVGNPFYAGTTLSCEVVSSRIYYVFQNGLVDSIKKMIVVESGIITAIQPCTYNPCSSYHILTQAEHDALPLVIIYEYNDPATPNPPVSYTTRSFTSRSEAIQHLSATTAQGSKASADSCSCTTSNLSVADTLYNDNRPEHQGDGSSQFYPVEAGYWGFRRTLPINGNAGQFTLIQTNACGQIVGSELITIPAS